MRIRIVCKLLTETPVLEFSYKAKIRRFIYNSLDRYNKDRFSCIHDSKKISVFSFSEITFNSGFHIDKTRGFVPKSKKFEFEISTFDQEIINSIKKRKSDFYNFEKNDFMFIVESVTDVELEDVTSCDFYSEFLITRKNEEGHIISYMPDESNFEKAFFNNLIKKYRHITGDVKKEFDISSMRLIIKNYIPGDKKYTGVENYDNDDKKAHNFKYFKLNFELECPDILKKIAYILGVGEKNNSGFGFVKKV
jgi:CRISPR-associated endoribonuclease Cas6